MNERTEGTPKIEKGSTVVLHPDDYVVLVGAAAPSRTNAAGAEVMSDPHDIVRPGEVLVLAPLPDRLAIPNFGMRGAGFKVTP